MTTPLLKTSDDVLIKSVVVIAIPRQSVCEEIM